MICGSPQLSTLAMESAQGKKIPRVNRINVVYAGVFDFADMSRHINCSRFPNMLQKLVVLCSTQLEDELPCAGYIASKSTHPDSAYFCKVCSFEYRDEVWKVFSVLSLFIINTVKSRIQYADWPTLGPDLTLILKLPHRRHACAFSVQVTDGHGKYIGQVGKGGWMWIRF